MERLAPTEAGNDGEGRYRAINAPIDPVPQVAGIGAGGEPVGNVSWPVAVLQTWSWHDGKPFFSIASKCLFQSQAAMIRLKHPKSGLSAPCDLSVGVLERTLNRLPGR